MATYTPISTDGFGTQLRLVVNKIPKSEPKPSYLLTGGQICVMLKHVTTANLFRHVDVVLVNTPVNLFHDNLQISVPGNTVQVARRGKLTGALVQIKMSSDTVAVNAVIFAVKVLIETFNTGLENGDFALSDEDIELLEPLNAISV